MPVEASSACNLASTYVAEPTDLEEADDIATVASFLSDNHVPKRPTSNRLQPHTQPSPRLAATLLSPRGMPRLGQDGTHERLPSLMSISAGLQLIRSSEKMVATQISGRFRRQLRGIPQISWRGIMNDDPLSGIENIVEEGGEMSTPQDHVFRNDARIHDTQMAGVEEWLNEVLKQKSAASLLYDLSVLTSNALPINHPREGRANTVALASRTMADRAKVLSAEAVDNARTGGEGPLAKRDKHKEQLSGLQHGEEKTLVDKARANQVTFTTDVGLPGGLHNLPLHQCGLHREALSAMGLQQTIIDRVYRSLFVYSVGFHNIIADIREHAQARSEDAHDSVERVTSSLWLLFIHLLEHCDESQHALMLSRVQKLYHGKLRRYADEIAIVLEATKDNALELRKIKEVKTAQEESLLMAREDAVSQVEQLVRGFQVELQERNEQIWALHDIVTATKHSLNGMNQTNADTEEVLRKQIGQLETQRSKLGAKCRRLELETGRSQQFREDALRKLDQYQTAKEWADDTLLNRKKKLQAALATNNKLSKQLAEETQRGNRLAELIEVTESARREAEEKARTIRSAEQSLERKVEFLQAELFRERSNALKLTHDVTGKEIKEIGIDTIVEGVGYGAGVDKHGNPIITEEMLAAARDGVLFSIGALVNEISELRTDHAQCILDRDSNAALTVIWQSLAAEARERVETAVHGLMTEIKSLEEQLKAEKDGREKEVTDLRMQLGEGQQKYVLKNAEAEKLHAQLAETANDLKRLMQETDNHQIDMERASKQLLECEQEIKSIEMQLRDEEANMKQVEQRLQGALEDQARSDTEIINLKAEDRQNKQKLMELDTLLKAEKTKHLADVARMTEERDDAINMLKEISEHSANTRSKPDSRAGSRPNSRAGSRPSSRSEPRPTSPSWRILRNSIKAVVVTPEKAKHTGGSAEALKVVGKTPVAIASKIAARPTANYSHRDVDLGFLARAQDVSARGGWNISRAIVLPPFYENERGALPPFNLDSRSDAYHRSTDAFVDQISIDKAKIDTASGATHRVSHLETKALVHKLHREMEGAELALHDYCIGYDLMSIRYQGALKEAGIKQTTIESRDVIIAVNKQRARDQVEALKSKLSIAKSLNQKVLDNAKKMHQKDVRNEYDLQKEIAKLKRDIKSRTQQVIQAEDRLHMVQDDYVMKLHARCLTFDAIVIEREALRTTLADEAAKNLAISLRLASSATEIANLRDKEEYLRGEVQDRDRMIDHLRDHIKQQEIRFADLKILVREQSHTADASTQYPNTLHASRAMQCDLSWVKGVLHTYTRGESASEFPAFVEHKVDYSAQYEPSSEALQGRGPEVPDGRPPQEGYSARNISKALKAAEGRVSSSTRQQCFYLEEPHSSHDTGGSTNFKIKYRVADKNGSQDSNDSPISSRLQTDAGSLDDDSESSTSIPFRAKRSSLSSKGTTRTDNQLDH